MHNRQITDEETGKVYNVNYNGDYSGLIEITFPANPIAYDNFYLDSNGLTVKIPYSVLEQLVNAKIGSEIISFIENRYV